MNRDVGKKLSREEIDSYNFVKVMFEDKSSVGNKTEYKINEVNIADNWNPVNTDPEEMGGFNFTQLTSVLRWLSKGNTIYDVEIPTDAEVYDCWYPTTPGVVFRSNKIIVRNPRVIDETEALNIYSLTNMKEELYYPALTGAIRVGFMETAKKIVNDRVNKSNVELYLKALLDDFTKERIIRFKRDNLEEDIDIIYNMLKNIKDN